MESNFNKDIQTLRQWLSIGKLKVSKSLNIDDVNTVINRLEIRYNRLMKNNSGKQGYQPTEDMTNPNPPQDSGTGGNT